MNRLLKILIIIIFLLFPINSFAEEFPDIKSKNAIMINLNDDSVIYEKNSTDKTLIASMTKIMTAIVAIENIVDIKEKVILDSSIFKGLANDLSVAGFKENDEVTYEDLLYGALLPSGADATHALAVFISGSEEEFVALMNKKAEELNLKNTHFTNTVGIESEDDMHYSTVEDVATILKYSLKNKTFKKIFESQKYTTSNGKLDFKSTKKGVEKHYERDFSYITGTKTGYTSKAGLCLASTAEKNNIKYLLVTAGAEKNSEYLNHFLDAETLYNYFFENYSYRTILKKNQVIDTIKTIYNEPVELKSSKNIKLFLRNDINISNLKTEYDGEKTLDKTINKDDLIGEIYIYDGEKVIYNEFLYSPVDVRFKFSKKEIMLFSLILIPLFLIFKMKKRKKY